MFISGGRTPHYEKVMGFIDGTNFLVELFKALKLDDPKKYRADKPPSGAIQLAQHLTDRFFTPDGRIVIRKYWFASYKGTDDDYYNYAKLLRGFSFEPVLFKKQNDREKGVDIALATEMLVNAFNQNYDVGVIVAGDKDYLGLVKEVKRYGPRIIGTFFRHGLSDDLKLAVDDFSYLIDGPFDKEHWKKIITPDES
jgi:uncharacterized LabA/DUF88 family protein